MKKADLRHRQAMRGLAVELLWQDDGNWWPATITQASVASVSHVLTQARLDDFWCYQVWTRLIAWGSVGPVLLGILIHRLIMHGQECVSCCQQALGEQGCA